MLIVMSHLVSLFTTNDASTVGLEQIEPSTESSVEEQRAGCHIISSMRGGAIGQEEICQPVGNRQSIFIPSFHGSFTGLDKMLGCPIGGRVIRSTPDVLD